MPGLTVVEPHPTIRHNTYTHSGRGGAGNYFRAPATIPSSGIPAEPKVLPPSSSNFYSGRGGAGNAHVSAKRPVMSFDEELKLKSQIEEKRIGYVGRGGAGNVYDAASPIPNPFRKGSDAASASSSSSSGSTRSHVGGFLGRVSTAFSSRRH